MSKNKTWSVRIQYYQDSTLLCDTWECYTLEQLQERLKSYTKSNIELQAIRIVRI